MDVAVTGAAGFIGGHLARRLADAGHRVRAVVRPEHVVEAAGVGVRRAEIRDADALRDALAGCDAVVHLAALTTRRRAAARDYEAVNVGGTRTVVEAARAGGVGRLVLGSTHGVYGRAGAGEPPRPNTPYRRSKHVAEAVALSPEAGIAASVVRIPAVLGPGTANWLGWVRDIASGRSRRLGDGAARKTVADVSDVVEGLALIAEAGAAGAVYDLAGPAPVTVGELTDLWAAGLDADVRPSGVPEAVLRALARLGDVADRGLRLDVPKAHTAEFFTLDAWRPTSPALAALGYTPRVGAPEAVARTLDGFRAAGLLPHPARAERPALLAP